jgi:hypothetical protein
MKTPEKMAEEYCNQDKVACDAINHAAEYLVKDAFLAGYKAGFEIGCIKGSMAMQSSLDEDYRLTPIIDHQKLARRMTKKEMKDEQDT